MQPGHRRDTGQRWIPHRGRNVMRDHVRRVMYACRTVDAGGTGLAHCESQQVVVLTIKLATRPSVATKVTKNIIHN